MARAIDVANFFIDVINGSEDDNVTNLKLQKLLYFSQGLCLRKTGKPLFREKIKAWKLGPVVPEVYQIFKPCGKAPILNPSESDYHYDRFSQDEKTVLFDTLLKYGKYTGSTLVDMTHKEGSPWAQSYDGVSENIEIPIQAIREYFTGLKLEPDIDAVIGRIPVVTALSADEDYPEDDELWED